MASAETAATRSTPGVEDVAATRPGGEHSRGLSLPSNWRLPERQQNANQGPVGKLAAKPELRGKVEPMHIDILETPLPNQVDLIVSAMAMHHVEDTSRLLQPFADHLVPGGKVALADLDSEDGSFHPPDTEGVFHHGFDRELLHEQLEEHGFSDVQIGTAVEVEREGKRYPVFLVTATRA